ncbi:16S rRNA (cytosine(1402)-N(4))-methyltransferase RsmH [Patescibacteria group bacterium]|nr:MAG: 16S rRNA (cytosine(1402)-N(4))-methyltransferase RsmH [Patescibacteria group bacterium]
MIHKSVLLQEVLTDLAFEKGNVFVDGTVNGGGHSSAVVELFGKDVQIVGIDLDTDALAKAKDRLAQGNVTLVNDSFRNIDVVLDTIGYKQADKILLDLGLSSNQFEESGRGFTFQKDEPLSMSFKKEGGVKGFTAYDIVNTWDEENIADVIYGYGEERYSRRIAKAIVEARETAPIKTTFELVEIIMSAVPNSYQHRKIHPATKTFQALRIAVNDELGSLRDGLSKGFERLRPAGRFSVISFHSTEDRIVKNFFKDRVVEKKALLVHKKPIIAGEQELTENPRARSAKLRTLQKI